MAGTDEIKEQKDQKDPETKRNNQSFIGRFLPWIVLTVIIIFCAVLGLGFGRLFASSRTLKIAQSASLSDKPNQLDMEDLSAKDAGKVWYYDLDPVVANLNEPGVTRYVRATFILEMNSEIDKKKGAGFLDEKKPIMINLLTVYLSSLGLEDIRGDKNLRSIQSYVCGAFNESLFPDSKPQIKHVLIKEFAVQ
ncbi:flagellar basal body-associated protein FliL [Planctomycetota bacterium]